MKHFLIAFLLAAIGTVAFVGTAHAASRYCYYNPDDPDCYNQGGYDDGQDDPFPPPPPPPRRPTYDDNTDYGTDDGSYDPPPPRRPRPVARPVSRCETIAVNLQRSGYRRVRPLDCTGPNYRFQAFRGGSRYILKIKSSNGRIVYEIRN